jgi:hypothetical protein
MRFSSDLEKRTFPQVGAICYPPICRVNKCNEGNVDGNKSEVGSGLRYSVFAFENVGDWVSIGEFFMGIDLSTHTIYDHEKNKMNTEIVLGKIQNAREACICLSYTYLYIQILRDLVLYGLSVNVLERDNTFEERIGDLIHFAAKIFEKNNLVKHDRKIGYFQ